MNFLAQQQATADALGLSLSITAQATQIKRYLNQAQRMIFQAHDWPFLRATNPLVVQTVMDYNTGTVSTTAGSTSVTFSGTISASKAGYYLQTSSSKDWYRIASHTAGTATATLDTAAISTGSGLTYTIRKFYYSLSGTPAVDRVISIRQSITPYQLQEMSKTVFEELKPDPNTTGTPKLYVMAGKDSSGVWQMSLWPVPDSVLNLMVECVQEPSDLSSDSEISLVPEKWRATVMVGGAIALGYQSLDDSRFNESWNLFNAGIEAMKLEFPSSSSKIRVMRASDSPLNLKPVPFPENYPLVR